MDWLTDLHCHILPYVDDGAEDLDEALELLRLQRQQNVGIVVLTPHSRTRLFETEDSVIFKQFQRLCREAERLGEMPELLLGREYFCDGAMMERAARQRLCTLGGGNTLLIEFSGRHTFGLACQRVKRLSELGYRPLIAHVERYFWVQEQPERLFELAGLGAQIQVNAGSVLGEQGWRQKRFCRRLMEQDLVDIIASDCHRTQWRSPNLGICQAYVERKMGRDYAHRIFCSNPAKLLSNRRRNKESW